MIALKAITGQKHILGPVAPAVLKLQLFLMKRGTKLQLTHYYYICIAPLNFV